MSVNRPEGHCWSKLVAVALTCGFASGSLVRVGRPRAPLVEVALSSRCHQAGLAGTRGRSPSWPKSCPSHSLVNGPIPLMSASGWPWPCHQPHHPGSSAGSGDDSLSASRHQCITAETDGMTALAPRSPWASFRTQRALSAPSRTNFFSFAAPGSSQSTKSSDMRWAAGRRSRILTAF